MPGVSSQMMMVPYDRAATLPDPLHIGVITPPFVPVPPRAYGGTEPMADTLCRFRPRRSSSDAPFDNGRAGSLADDQRELVEGLQTRDDIDRRHCRVEVEVRFSPERMCSDYVDQYLRVIAGRSLQSSR